MRVAAALLLASCGASPPRGAPDLCVEITTDLEAQYQRASCLAHFGEPERAFAALDRVLAAGFHDLPRLRADREFAVLRIDPRWPTLLADADARVAAWETTLVDPALRRDLLALRIMKDEAARIGLEDTSTAQSRRMEVARHNAIARVKMAVAKYGWPGNHIAGDDGAHAAEQIVEDSADRAFQKQCLPLLEAAARAGDAAMSDYQTLDDRIAREENRPQRWHTDYSNRNERVTR